MPITDRGPVPVPPPLLYLAALLAGIALDRLWPLALLPHGWDYAVGTVLVAASVSIIPSILMRFRRAGTPLDVRKPASALIADGPYRFSRNPTYVSMTLADAQRLEAGGRCSGLGSRWHRQSERSGTRLQGYHSVTCNCFLTGYKLGGNLISVL